MKNTLTQPPPKRPKILAVVGPTASGKSALALSLAQSLSGELISTDSMQIYRKMDIGTAKPTLEEQALIPHHQLDLIEPNEHYSAARYSKEVEVLIQKLLANDKVPILVGGTGLYYRCALFGICEVPEIPLSVKQQIDHWHRIGLHVCYEKLKEIDPRSAERLHANDTTRILRALEVALATGNSLQQFQQAQPFNQPKYEVMTVGYQFDRPNLYNRINKRTLAMLNAGWIEEVCTLRNAFSPELKPLQAIGYRQINEFLDRRLTREEMIDKIQQKTRNYAKRQLTWFRKEPNIQWYPPEAHSEVIEASKVFLEK